MNTQKIDCQEHVDQRFSRDYCNFEYVNNNHGGFQQPWNMGIRVQAAAMEDPGTAKSSNTIMGGFQSPSSAFYATERCMGFPQYGSQMVGSSSFSSQIQYIKTCNSQIPSFHASGENFSIESVAQDEPNYEFRNTLQSPVKPQIYCNQNQKSSGKYYRIPCRNSQGSRFPLCDDDQTNLLTSDEATVGNHFSGPFQGSQDQSAYCNSYSSSLAQLSFIQQESLNQSSNCSPGGFPVSSGNSVSTGGAVLASKTRIRWTQDLHDKFVECVKRLGGAEKATPKAILKLMDTEGLTIFHVKSHLQKYRIAKYMPDSSEGKSEKSSTTDIIRVDVKTGLHLTEALQLQLDFQRRLHEQLEIQRNLQLRIEEQGRQLKMMIDQQQKTNESLLKKQDLDIAAFDHDPSFSLEDFEASVAESSRNAINSHPR